MDKEQTVARSLYLNYFAKIMKENEELIKILDHQNLRCLFFCGKCQKYKFRIVHGCVEYDEIRIPVAQHNTCNECRESLILCQKCKEEYKCENCIFTCKECGKKVCHFCIKSCTGCHEHFCCLEKTMLKGISQPCKQCKLNY